MNEAKWLNYIFSRVPPFDLTTFFKGGQHSLAIILERERPISKHLLVWPYWQSMRRHASYSGFVQESSSSILSRRDCREIWIWRTRLTSRRKLWLTSRRTWLTSRWAWHSMHSSGVPRGGGTACSGLNFKENVAQHAVVLTSRRTWHSMQWS